MCNRILKMAVFDSGLKSFEAARKAGLRPATFSAIVNEHIPPTEKQKKAIAKVFKKRVSQLFGEKVANTLERDGRPV